MNVLWFAIFATASLFCTRVFVRYSDRATSILYSIYALSYLVTVVVGATILGLSSGTVWGALNFGVDTSLLEEPGFTYWCLLFSPLILVPLVIVASKKLGSVHNTGQSRRTEISLPVFAFVFAGFAVYCFAQIYSAGALANVLGGLRMQDYQEFILARVDLLSFARTPFYGVIYMSLPALSCLAMFQAFSTRETRWWFAFVAAAGITVILSLSTMLKGPTFLLFVLLVLARHVLKPLPLYRIMLAGVTVFVAFTLWQGLFYSAWSAVGTVYMVFFRMAHGFPFYVSLFPKTIPYLGSNYGLAIFGVGGGNNDNLLVFDQMYPAVRWVQGATAAPAHVRAFAQAGLPYALFSLTVVAVIIGSLALLRGWKTNPYRFALFSQGMLAAYYLSQTSIRGVFVESFSVVFGLVAIAAVWALDVILSLAARNVRSVVTNQRYA